MIIKFVAVLSLAGLCFGVNRNVAHAFADTAGPAPASVTVIAAPPSIAPRGPDGAGDATPLTTCLQCADNLATCLANCEGNAHCECDCQLVACTCEDDNCGAHCVPHDCN